MSEPILKAEHLGITFGGLKAVSDFNMTINSGELVGLIGPNGAGKTTVFNLLTGVYQPTEGEFFLDGERMNGKKTYQVVRAGIARTFQNIRLFGQMTVEENVLVAFNESFSYHMGGAIFRTPKFWKQEREMHAKAIDLLKIFGLEGLAETEAANLPYGAQRKLEIARALATGMKLLLLDEPAAGMNPTETEDLLNCINTIRDRFYGVDRFIQQGRNLYKFKEYIEERGEPIVWINDLERGVIGWDMAQVVGLARAAKDCGYITKEQAWEYIEQASTLCSEILRTPEEIDKSFLIGGAMKSNKIEDWEELILCYSLLRNSGE